MINAPYLYCNNIFLMIFDVRLIPQPKQVIQNQMAHEQDTYLRFISQSKQTIWNPLSQFSDDKYWFISQSKQTIWNRTLVQFIDQVLGTKSSVQDFTEDIITFIPNSQNFSISPRLMTQPVNQYNIAKSKNHYDPCFLLFKISICQPPQNKFQSLMVSQVELRNQNINLLRYRLNLFELQKSKQRFS